MTPPLLYLLVDTSGSTVRNGFGWACNLALPGLVVALEQRHGRSARLALLTYGTTATSLVPLTPVADLEILPALRPSGLSSMAAGLRLLAGTLTTDRHQLTADGFTTSGTVALLITDGLPTDPAGELLAARHQLTAVPPHSPDLHLAVPPGTDELSLAALAATVHPLTGTTPPDLAASLITAAHQALAPNHT